MAEIFFQKSEAERSWQGILIVYGVCLLLIVVDFVTLLFPPPKWRWATENKSEKTIFCLPRRQFCVKKYNCCGFHRGTLSCWIYKYKFLSTWSYEQNQFWKNSPFQPVCRFLCHKPTFLNLTKNLKGWMYKLWVETQLFCIDMKSRRKKNT